MHTPIPGRLVGKRALITGASRGIGRAIAIRLAAEGALVGVNYATHAAAAADVVNTIEAAGGAAFAIHAQIGAMSAIDALWRSWDEEVGRRCGDCALDILVNNAGITAGVPLTQVDEEGFDRIFDTNTKGAAFVTQAAVKRLRHNGRIVTITSGAGKHPSARNTIYGMSKAALHAMTVGLACELGSRGITANCVSPGWTVTDITAKAREDSALVGRVESATALGRLGQPEDIAAVVAFLVSPDGGWLTGQWIDADGGYKLIPPA
jgi:3-oxoacyl-[acyl-carrier protein] reductase